MSFSLCINWVVYSSIGFLSKVVYVISSLHFYLISDIQLHIMQTVLIYHNVSFWYIWIRVLCSSLVSCFFNDILLYPHCVYYFQHNELLLSIAVSSRVYILPLVSFLLQCLFRYLYVKVHFLASSPFMQHCKRFHFLFRHFFNKFSFQKSTENGYTPLQRKR